MLKGTDVAPVDLVGMAVEVLIAKALQPSEYHVDLGFLGEEGGECGVLVALCLLCAQLMARRGDRVQAGHRGVS